MKVLNVSNHVLTEVQLDDLRVNWDVDRVIELPDDLKAAWSNLTPDNYRDVCDKILEFSYRCNDTKAVFIHLAGFPAAVNYIAKEHPGCIYAYSERTSTDIPQPDGTVKKVSVFNHKGFYRYDD